MPPRGDEMATAKSTHNKESRAPQIVAGALVLLLIIGMLRSVGVY
jgi:hypothetical protein